MTSEQNNKHKIIICLGTNFYTKFNIDSKIKQQKDNQ